MSTPDPSSLPSKNNDASNSTHEKTMASAKRKSWFRLSRLTKVDSAKAKSSEGDHKDTTTSTTNNPPTSHCDPESLRPIEFLPNRIATLYVTPSERNLYLAAMSQLDEGPPPLPLWSDPPPALPQLKAQAPFDAPAIPTANGHLRSMSEGTNHHPLTSRPLSPKLVTSPGMQPSGLMIRDEFRRAPPAKSTKHALLALTLPAGMRFTGFPAPALVAVSDALQEGWPLGVLSRTLSIEELKRRNYQDTPAWKVTLEGRAWKRKGHQELDSIRLLLAILNALGTHGWSIVDSVQVGASKKDAHNLLFSYLSEVSAAPPVLFAVSMPLPDRLSLISPPSKATPALIAAMRSVLIANSPLNPHAREGTANTSVTTTTESSAANKEKGKGSRVTWNGGKEQGIKLEGWVHTGVYRFWLDGMRRWIGRGIKRSVVDSFHPRLLISLIDLFSTIHFEFAASIPLLPITKGRDVLFFASSPTSGLTPRDRYISIYKNTSTAGSKSESPILVSATEFMALPEHTGVASTNHDEAGPEIRALPWDSVIQAGQPETAGSRAEADTPARSPFPPPSPAHSTPKQRHVLLKKNSLRNRSASGNNSSRQGSLRQHSDQAQTTRQTETPTPIMGDHRAPLHVTNATSTDEDRWSIVNPPPNVEALGVSTNDLVTTSASPALLAKESTSEGEWDFDLGNRQSADHTTGSGDSVYVDADAQTRPSNDLQRYARALQGEGHSPESEMGAGSELNHAHPISQPLRLGQPIDHAHAEALETVPVKESNSPRRARQGLVEVTVHSMHGSVGYLQSVLSRKSQEGGVRTPDGESLRAITSEEEMRRISLDQTRPRGQIPASSITARPPGGYMDWEKKGKGKQGTRRLWDENQGGWVDVPIGAGCGGDKPTSVDTGRQNGAGSARTRVYMG